MSGLVAGVDSSTQSCKVVVREADTGKLVREGRAAHPDGTEVHPDAWWRALQEAVEAAGGLDDVDAVAVAGQQHGMVCLDEAGEVVRPALLWNDTRSAPQAAALVEELGREHGRDGRDAWAESVGSVPVASFTVTKLRWLAEEEPEHLRRTAGVCLPHDYLTWRLSGGRDLETLTTDRSDASGTGYWSAAADSYRTDLLRLATGGTEPRLPTVAGPADRVGVTGAGTIVAAGAGDNAGAALGLQAGPGDVVVSLGTSGVVAAVTGVPSADPSGLVAGFADATGRFLPLVCTLNAARVLDATARLLGVDHETLSDLALSAPAGADGLVLVPWLEGERTPDVPLATGTVEGLTLGTSTPAHLARATVEGLLCGLADGLDALVAQGATPRRLLLVGGGAASAAVRRIAPTVLGLPVDVPEPGEYVADGAARQAAWALAGDAAAPAWRTGSVERHEAEPLATVRERYAEARDRALTRFATGS